MTFYGNRGMTLEEDINLTNEYYREKNIALIYKKPILRTNETKTRIKDGFYEQKSTLDYNGIYQGMYIEFDAKETNSKTSFPLSNIHIHQIEHIKAVLFYNFTANFYWFWNRKQKNTSCNGNRCIYSFCF